MEIPRLKSVVPTGLPTVVLLAAALVYSTLAQAVTVRYVWVPDDDAVTGEMFIEIGMQDPDNFTVAAANFDTPGVDFDRFDVICPVPVICPNPITFDNFIKAGFLDISTANITAVSGEITVLDMDWNQADGNTLLFGVGTLDVLHGGTQVTHTGLWVNESSLIPIPAAIWLFGSGLLGLIGIARRKKA